MTDYNYDVIVIGAGPGGYLSAIRLAQLGKKVCVVEKRGVGGVCLNRGCIPTKAFVQSARLFKHIQKADNLGIEVNDFKLNIDKVLSRKDEIVSQLKGGIEFLFKQKGIELINSPAKFIDEHTIEADQKQITAEFIVIATGSAPFKLPDLPFDGEKIISSDGIFELKNLPKSILIVGGGAIGSEFASIFNLFGIEITLLELMDHVLPNEDREVSKKLQVQLAKSGIKILTKTKVDSFTKGQDNVQVKFSNGEEAVFEKILVCVGRQVNLNNLCIENTKLERDQKGYIKVDEFLRTSVKNIYAIGDVIGGWLLAHVASHEGIKAAECICGHGPREKISYKAVPNCVFTEPEYASVGISEDKAKDLGKEVLVGRFPFKSHGKSRILDETEGLVKVVVDKNEKVILGAQILGYDAGELIAIFTALMNSNMVIDDINEIIFAHPTLSEAIGESLLNIQKRSIHTL